jgi:hypothetical protein
MIGVGKVGYKKNVVAKVIPKEYTSAAKQSYATKSV